MGIGTPEYIFTAVENGIDMFDCVYPTRIARNGSVFTRQGILDLKKSRFELEQEPIDENCQCPACKRYSRSYLRQLFKAKEILGPMLATIHNLSFLHKLMIEIRESIQENRFTEYKKSFLNEYLG